MKLLNNCLGEKSNYSLFKFIYLTPARTLLYNNLYEEIKHFVQEKDKDFDFEKCREKEEKYIKNIEKEIEQIIEQTENEYNHDDKSSYDVNKKEKENEFKCFDDEMKSFIGFDCDIIPGEIVREEIVKMASTETFALYRIEYFTKYFDKNELRNILMNKKEEENEKKVKNDEMKEEESNKKRNEVNKKGDKKEDEMKKGDNKDDNNKKNDNKGKEIKEDVENRDIEKGDDEEKDSDQKIDNDHPEKNDSEKDEEKGEEEKKEEIIETEIDDSLLKEKNAEKVDISEQNENSYIYNKNLKRPIILEDQALNDRNKVKATLYRYIFTNLGVKKRYFI